MKFLSDSSFSEIPTSWLIYDENNEVHECWWPPRTANCAILINQSVVPNHGVWKIFEIEFVKNCCKYF